MRGLDKINNRKIWLALALLIAGLVLTGAAALYEKRGAESIARKDFDFACNEIKDRILKRIQQHAQILRSASAFYKINENITREQWHNSIAHQNIEQVLPGIQGIGYTIIIPPDQLALHERKIRNEGFPQYAVKPMGKREIYTSIIYLEPFSGRNLRAFGYDMFSEPIRRKAMEHARDFDEATLSAKITLVQETGKDVQAGTLMYVPIYARGLPVKTIEGRRRAIRGWVYSPYRMNDLMRGILGGWELGEGRQIRLEVFDGTSFQSEALLYDSMPGQKLEHTSTMLSEQTSILFKNHHWSLRFTQIGDHTGGVDYSKSWFVLIGGTVVSALLFALYLLLINANYRAHTLAEALTRELRESTERKWAEEKLRQQTDAMDVAIDGMALLNVEGEYFYLNKAHAKVYGYENAGELIGKSWRILYDSDVLQHFDQEIMPELSRKGNWQGEAIGTKKNGSKFSQGLSLTVMDNGGLICVVRDITDRKRAEKQIVDTLESLRKSFAATIQVMVSAVESRDPYTSGHQTRVADLARAIATEMELPQDKIEGLRMAGSIHDIGKLSIPAEILSKPTKLTNLEFSLIKEHARKGYEMLKDVESPWPLAEIIFQHHERIDGSGYPRNLKGEEILIEARILMVADVVEAMASHRPYRPGLGLDAALNEIEKNRGIFYDEAVVDACLRLFREKGFKLENT